MDGYYSIREINLYHITIRYPSIKLFATECYIHGQMDKLFDFLMEIETEDPANVASDN